MQINTQPIPAIGPLMATMPSGREIHTLKVFTAPVLDSSILEGMRAPPDQPDEVGSNGSSDEEREEQVPVGAFPGTQGDYSHTSNYY